MKVFRPYSALALALFSSLMLVLAGCGGTGKPTLKSIVVTPMNPTIVLGTTQQFTATGTFSDNTTQDITASVTWSSGTAATATISAGGLATSVAGGTSVITATSGTITGTSTLKVVTLVSIALTPANPALGVGATLQFKATATYSDNSTADISGAVTWNSATSAHATISASGLATAVAPGTSVITAKQGAMTSLPDTLTVTPPTLVSIMISPANPTIPVGGTADFTGVGLYSDNSTQPLAPITWSTTAPASSVTVNSANNVGVTLGLVPGNYPIKATGGGVTGNTSVTVVAGASRFAYAANGGDGTISIYAVSGSTFTPRGYALDPHSAIQVLPDPSGKYVFALNVDHTISTYYVDPVTGALTDAATLATPITPVSNGGGAGVLPYEGVFDPTGQFLYVANNVDSNITAFSVKTTDGSLKEIGVPITVGVGPTMVLTDRSGSYLYVVNNNSGGVGSISGFSINPNSGALTTLVTVPAFPATVGTSPFFAAIDPSNKYLYVGDLGDDTVAGFTINSSNGALTAMAGSPFSVAAGTGPYAVAVDPSSKYLYVGNYFSEDVSGFPIGAGGVPTIASPLFTPVSSSPTGSTSGSIPFSMSIDPAGTFLTVSNSGSNGIALFTVTPATGVLTAAGNIESRSGPQFTNMYYATSKPTLSPAAVFAANSTAGTISEYMAASTGVLTATGAPTNGKPGNSASTTDVTGNYFFATSSPSPNNDLLGFSIAQSTAGLGVLGGSPLSLGTNVPSSVLSEPSDRFVFTAETGAPGSLLSLTLSPTTGINMIAGPLSVGNLKAIVEDPQGRMVYTLGMNLIEQLPINGANGTFSPATPAETLTTSGTWTAGAVDASGQYLVALDSVGKKMQVFSIGPLSSFATVGGSVATGGTLPSSLVLDPLNRFVFVTDATANTVTVFTFNAKTGAISLPAVSTTTLSGSAGQATVDATGNFLYVAVEGTPVTNAGSVAAFQISANGTLTALAGSPYAAGVGTSGVAVSNSIK